MKHVGLRGLIDPEAAHPRWNGFKRSSTKSVLDGAMLKATLMGGWRRGPYQSGSNFHTSKSALELHIRDSASFDWLEARAELIYQDKLMTEYY